ncbi:MAG: hypothetical protein KAR20_03275 [Candidatus Heimdallarchaeota archaeon]|nr:hypothetical protein [Candidatus Heimdallarchaeota archaeon]
MITEKKAQIWGLDILAGMMLFLIGIIVFFVYSLNQPGEAQDNFELLLYDGKIIADNLMSPGYPLDWNSSNVITLGISDDNKINETKLERLYEMIYTENNYTRTKNILNTQYEYYFFLEQNMTINSMEVEGIGKPGATRNNIDARNLIKITRFTVYQNKTIPLYIYLWEE